MDSVTLFVIIVPLIFIVPHLLFANRRGLENSESNAGGGSIYVPMRALPTAQPMNCQSQINLFDGQ